MLKVYKNVKKFKIGTNYLGWANDILIKTSIDNIRSNSRHSKVMAPVESNIIEANNSELNQALNDLATEQIFELIQKLDDNERLVFSMYVIDGYKHREIEEQTGINANTSKWLLSNDRKGIAWWKFGGLFALLLIPASIYLMGGSFGNEEISQSGIVNFTAKTPIATNKNSDKETVIAQTNNSSANENQAPAITTEKTKTREAINNAKKQTNQKASKSSSKTSDSQYVKNKKQQVLKTPSKPSTEPKPTFSIPRAANSSQLNTSKLPNAKAGQNIKLNKFEKKSDLVLGQEINLIADLAIIAGLDASSFNVAERELPGLAYAPYHKVYPKVKNNPWYMATSFGAKYPLADISNPIEGSFIPDQGFFPSYLAEIGLGKKIGKFSVEAGATASLYQYKLGKVSELENGVATIADELEWQINPYYEISADRLELGSNGFSVNRFAVLSPYVRGQYSFDLRKNFILGLHALVTWNKRLNINEENPLQLNNQFAANHLGNGAVKEFFSGKSTNINYDVGFSVEKQFAKRGRMALDFSYGFATGILEAGTYSVSRQAMKEPVGSYSINGAGPKVKFRYYLYSKGI